MAFKDEAHVHFHEEVAPGCFLIRLVSAEIARSARPGQFVNVRCGDTYDPLLRRPISIHRIDPEAGEISLLYRVVGRGTRKLSALKAGETLDIVGPLGNGFKTEGFTGSDREAVLLGGGIGAAPLFALAAELADQRGRVMVMLGASTSVDLLQVEEFRSLGLPVLLATDDGSAGGRGTVVDAFRSWLKDSGKKPGLVFACGPHPMIKALQRLCAKAGIELQVALEERMGCGLGGCLSCVCKIKSGGDSDWRYARVCQEGPVFSGEEVLLDE
ncbi:MAG: dihydroorotate dehydrogenase electron transfer subunit [Firmicutes bacterium]|nr:dihydroorotate dehydrogenase electron transfer subunit [Bacillota bacterium]